MPRPWRPGARRPVRGSWLPPTGFLRYETSSAHLCFSKPTVKATAWAPRSCRTATRSSSGRICSYDRRFSFARAWRVQRATGPLRPVPSKRIQPSRSSAKRGAGLRSKTATVASPLAPSTFIAASMPECAPPTRATLTPESGGSDAYKSGATTSSCASTRMPASFRRRTMSASGSFGAAPVARKTRFDSWTSVVPAVEASTVQTPAPSLVSLRTRAPSAHNAS
mmetsp:Transcript_24857/g.76757  ORF Transcript_24857/g.76757 Transcript_24857/m.76757 type:complete len:223 (-) Transcript_24857:394-1062(-)